MEYTFDFMGLMIKVSYDYTPAEPMTRECPGCDEEYNLQAVEHAGVLINDFIDRMDLWDDVEEELIKAIESDAKEGKAMAALDNKRFNK